MSVVKLVFFFNIQLWRNGQKSARTRFALAPAAERTELPTSVRIPDFFLNFFQNILLGLQRLPFLVPF